MAFPFTSETLDWDRESDTRVAPLVVMMDSVLSLTGTKVGSVLAPNDTLLKEDSLLCDETDSLGTLAMDVAADVEEDDGILL